MAGLFQMDASVGIENRLGGIHIQGESGSGKDEIQLDHDLQVSADSVDILCGLLAEVGENGFDFFLLLKFQFADVIV